VELVLGAAVAAKWAATITSPPLSLARKLGITEMTVVRAIGNINDESLKAAVAAAARVSSEGADLIVACVDTPESLLDSLKQARAALARAVPIWIVYAKGPGHALNEGAIRALLRANGLMDTKVASVSPALTATRFNFRKSD
jgi:membrane-bound ClpP family serine protease